MTRGFAVRIGSVTIFAGFAVPQRNGFPHAALKAGDLG
jgi:hypothetical protein